MLVEIPQWFTQKHVNIVLPYLNTGINLKTLGQEPDESKATFMHDHAYEFVELVRSGLNEEIYDDDDKQILVQMVMSLEAEEGSTVSGIPNDVRDELLQRLSVNVFAFNFPDPI